MLSRPHVRRRPQGANLSRRPVIPLLRFSKWRIHMTYLNNWSRGVAAGTIALLLTIGTPALAADNPQVAAEIMSLARAQWASEIAGEPMAQQNASLADDYTEFNGDFPTLLVGKAT